MMTKDPVCGMEIDREEAIGVSEHEGQNYYFCCSMCKEKFDADPSRYSVQTAGL
ncbi:MAG: YHS domain-containing protein [Elusimicrobiota bacterium]|jgi:P-type Cu+ transporter